MSAAALQEKNIGHRSKRKRYTDKDMHRYFSIDVWGTGKNKGKEKRDGSGGKKRERLYTKRGWESKRKTSRMSSASKGENRLC